MKIVTMNKILGLLVLFLTISSETYSQNPSYGLILGINSTNIESSSGTWLFSEDTSGLDGYNFGIYLDIPLNNKFGIKSYLTYNNEIEEYNRIIFVEQYNFDSRVKSIQFSTLLKYHLKKEYNKGIYIMGGPRVTHILETSSIWNGVEDFYENYNFGFQLGIGFTLYKFINTELIGDYGFSNILNIESLEAKSYNLKLNLSINIENLIK
jgi:hypothetical protein